MCVLFLKFRILPDASATITAASSNPELKNELLSTGNKILVEASPLDNVWGIGMDEDAQGVEDPSYWLGLNLLGQALTLVKNELRGA
jgi:ribA/ribD-fused uncharacterized protein